MRPLGSAAAAREAEGLVAAVREAVARERAAAGRVETTARAEAAEVAEVAVAIAVVPAGVVMVEAVAAVDVGVRVEEGRHL